MTLCFGIFVIGILLKLPTRQENAGEGFSNVLNLFKKPTMRAKTLILYYEVILSIIL